MNRQQIAVIVSTVVAIEMTLAYLFYWRVEPEWLFRATSLALGSRFVAGVLIGAFMRNRSWVMGGACTAIAVGVGSLTGGVMHYVAWAHGLTSDFADISGAVLGACLGAIVGFPFVAAGFAVARALFGLGKRRQCMRAP